MERLVESQVMPIVDAKGSTYCCILDCSLKAYMIILC